MTTIAINTKMIAADSQACRGQERIHTPATKIIIRGDWLYASAGLGNEGFKESMMAWHAAGADPKTIPPVKEDNFTFLALRRGTGRPVMFTDRCAYSDEVDLPNAFGSGREYALALLDAGYSPLEAVEGAIKRDLWSGGPVITFDLLTFERIYFTALLEAAE